MDTVHSTVKEFLEDSANELLGEFSRILIFTSIATSLATLAYVALELQSSDLTKDAESKIKYEQYLKNFIIKSRPQDNLIYGDVSNFAGHVEKIDYPSLLDLWGRNKVALTTIAAVASDGNYGDDILKKVLQDNSKLISELLCVTISSTYSQLNQANSMEILGEVSNQSAAATTNIVHLFTDDFASNLPCMRTFFQEVSAHAPLMVDAKRSRLVIA